MIELADKKVVIVTGAASGIGLALARLLWTREEYRVVVTIRPRSRAKIEAEPFKDNDRFMIREMDINDVRARHRLVAEVLYRWKKIDVLINNAGIAYRSVSEHMSDSDFQNQLSTNFLSPMSLCRLVLPIMRSRESGHIINISSVGGMMAMPTMGAYSASKWALEGATEALWYEMRPWNVNVTLIQPGFVKSDSFKNVYLNSEASHSVADPRDPYHHYYHHMSPFISKFMNRSMTTPADIALKIVRTMESPRPPLRVQATPDAAVFSLMRRLLPRSLYHWLLYWLLPGIRSWRNSPVLEAADLRRRVG